MKIYRGNIELVDIELDDNSVFKHVIMGDETCTLNFTIPQYYDFTIGDYILYEGQKFTMNVASSVVKNHSNSYTYSIIFEGIKYDLSKVLCTMSGKFGTPIDFFSYTNMEGILDLIISNANRLYDVSWQKGVCSVTPYFNFQITNENCLQVLNKACLEFNVEFECLTTETGNVINVRDSIGINEGTTLEYKKGILSLKREPSSQDNIITRLYPRGSDKNIPDGYRMNRIWIDYIYGENVSMGIFEQAVIFDDIFPHFEGELTRVSDTSFSCAEIDFNLNDYLIPGVTARVAFLSGDLAGYIFDIDSYDNGTKTVTINTLIDDIERTLPNADYVITTGDKFTFVDIYMPTAYLTAAEAELLERATEYLEKYNYPSYKYSITVDSRYLRANNISLYVGESITIVDNDMGINQELRIYSMTKSLANPYKYDIELTDRVQVSKMLKLIYGQFDIQKRLEQYEKEIRIVKNN